MKKKRSHGMHVIRIVLYMLCCRGKSKPLNNGFWRRVVGSIRQLKTDNITLMPSSNISILPPLATEEAPTSNEDQLLEMVDVFTATSSSSSSSRISGYGSAKSLRDMNCLDEDDDYNDDSDDDDECYGDDDHGGDEMIDEKAEKFIERFYEQMRMQNQAYSGRYKAKEIIVV